METDGKQLPDISFNDIDFGSGIKTEGWYAFCSLA